MEPAGSPRVFTCDLEVRSYELDSFGHANHAVFLNWFETARFGALAQAGTPVDEMMAEGLAVVVVRVEIDYRNEALLGDRFTVHTRLEGMRNSSMTLRQRALRGEEVLAEATVVAVWLRDGNPVRVPDRVKEAFGPP